MKKYLLVICFLVLVYDVTAQFQLNWYRTERDTASPPGYSLLEDLVLDENNNVYVNGTIDSLQTIIPIYISYDSSGTERWRRTISELGLNFSWRSLKSPLGHVVFAGEYEDQTGTNNMIYAEYNYSGDSIGGGILNSPGFTTGDDLGDICVDRSGNLFLGGQIRIGSDFPAAVARFDSGSEFRWLSSYPILPGWSAGDVRAIEMCGDTGLYCLTFNFTGYASLLYCDTSGTFDWAVTLPVSISNYHSALTTDADNNAIVGGNYNNNFGLVKINPFGDTMWTRNFIYPGLTPVGVEVVNVKTDSLNNIYVLGISSGINQYSLITKFDASGTLLWMDTAGAVGSMYGSNKEFMQIKDGQILFITNAGGGHYYSYNSVGQRILDQPLLLPGLIDPEVDAIEYGSSSIYITGSSNIGFNVRLGFIARFDVLTNRITEQKNFNSMKLFPNPTNEILNFEVTNIGFAPEEYKIYSIDGHLIKAENCIRSNSIDVKNFRKGVYFICFSDGRSGYCARFEVF